MNAVRWHATADVRLDDVPGPALGDAHDILVRVEACGMCGTDVEEARHGPNSIPTAAPHLLTGRIAPLTLGHEILGEVVEAGTESGRHPGERVVVWPTIPCGTCATCLAGDEYRCPDAGCVGLSADGGFARRVVVDGRRTALMESDLPMERAVLVEPYAVALHAFAQRDPSGRSVAVFGVGSIGFALIDVARHLGATRVIGVSRSVENRRMAEQAGATETLEWSQVDGLDLDIAVDASGNPDALTLLATALAHGGLGLVVGIKRHHVDTPLWEIFRRELHIAGSNGTRFLEDFARAARLISDGRLAARPRPVARVHLRDLPDVLLGRQGVPVGAKPVVVPD